jgi:hypothetical protein
MPELALEREGMIGSCSAELSKKSGPGYRNHRVGSGARNSVNDLKSDLVPAWPLPPNDT